jgi:NAD(P)H-dependent FMN reductase
MPAFGTTKVLTRTTGPLSWVRSWDWNGTIKIVGIAGSLRRASVNRMLLDAAAQALPADVDFAVWDSLHRVPPFNEDWEADPAPVAVAELRHEIADTDVLLIATPEYNGTRAGGCQPGGLRQ